MKYLVAVTPIWRRPALTTQYIRQMQRWKDRARNFSLLLVGSERKRSKALAVPGTWYIEHRNKPLGKKFNAGIRKALEMGADYVLIMGSDQFADVSMLDKYIELMEEDVPYAGVLDTYVLDGTRALYWKGYSDERKGMPVGPGRLIRRDVIESIGDLYANGLSRNLDGSADAKLPDPVVFSGKPYRFVSVKTGESITPARRYKGRAVKASLFQDFFE